MTRAYHWVSWERMERRGMLVPGAHHVSTASNGADVARVVLGTQLGAQAGDAYIEAVVADVGVESPGGLDELRAQHHLAGAAHQELQQDVLLVGQQNGAAAAVYLMG